MVAGAAGHQIHPRYDGQDSRTYWTQRNGSRPQVSTRPRDALLGRDVSVYLQQQTPSSPGAIGMRVGEAIREGAESSRRQDPLVVVAHSMGGNIVYDLLA